MGKLASPAGPDAMLKSYQHVRRRRDREPGRYLFSFLADTDLREFFDSLDGFHPDADHVRAVCEKFGFVIEPTGLTVERKRLARSVRK